jgi:hypothetical protein
MRSLRQWLLQGGRLWVMLDKVEPNAIAPLLGDALDFQVVDRVGLTTTRIETQPTGLSAPEPVAAQDHERPVDLVRVLLSPQDRVLHTVNGWPASFTRQVGSGKVLFTTLGPRAWFRSRKRADGQSPYPRYPFLPAPTGPLEVIADELRPPEMDLERVQAFRPLLTEEIGYSVLGRGAVVLVCGGFLMAALAVGVALRKAPRLEVLGYLGPLAALGAAVTLVVLGEESRRAVPPTMAFAQVVEPAAGTQEASVRGLLALYRPDSGPVEVGVRQGGRFELDMTGVEDETRTLILTDIDSWHWDNIALPAGVRFAPLRSAASTGGPIRAVARFGPEGLEGKVEAGLFRDLGDAILGAPQGRNLAVRLRPDGSFTAGSADVLPPGQFLAGAVLSDRQQRQQEVYRELLKRPAGRRPEGGNVLLAWATPIDLDFTPAPEGPSTHGPQGPTPKGSSLLVIPLELERPSAEGRVTIPGAFIPCRQLVDNLPTGPLRELTKAADMHLRFQLPAVVLPFKVERARLSARIHAPSRRVTVAGRADDGLVEVHRVESPLDPLRVEITDERLLRLDEQGGLHLNVSVSDVPKGGGAGQRGVQSEEKWTIEYLELEVGGRAAADKTAPPDR